MGIGIAQGIDHSGKQPLVVHPVMLVKTHVLNGDQSVFQHIRDLVYIRPVPVFHAGKGGDQVSVLIVNIGSLVAFGNLRSIQLWGGINVSFGDPHHQAHADAPQ